jgi:hypothetical protein
MGAHAARAAKAHYLISGERLFTRKKRIFGLYEDTSSLEPPPEAECWDVIGTKVLGVFLLAIHSHLY